jgi:type II secretory pathway predicted ATPase ExeA
MNIVKYMESKIKQSFNWDSNPFTFQIAPDLLVGYGKEINEIQINIDNGSKFSLLLGPTGSGKTTMIKHISDKFSNFKHIIYLPKPPRLSEDWVTVFNEFTKKRFSFLSKGNGANLYNLSDKVNEKLHDEKCLVFVDECHEASIESLEWLRTLTDQINNLHVVLAGLPVLETILKENLETFIRRINTRIELSSLTKSETRELIKKRIENSGGSDTQPFTPGTIDYIHERTGGFPREILKTCNELVMKALEKNITIVDTDFLNENETPSKISLSTLDELPPKQKEIIDIIFQEGQLTPSEIVNKIKQDEYKNKDNAVRSVNNLVRRLMSEGFVDRKKVGKTYKYIISPRYRTLLVNA